MKEEKPLKGKSDPAGAVDNYLFDGNWTEKDGVKWAFFETDKETGETSKESIQQEKIEKGQSLSEKQVISDKISITDLGRASGGQRYSEGSPLPPSGPIKKDTFLSGRYKIQELYKSLEKRDFYLARDIRLDTICIVKELTVDSNDREEVEYYRNRFKEEARILANLNHPNLPVVTDYFIENNRYFMVLDYIKGYDLETLLACSEVSITEEQILLWGIDICEVLEYLHSQKPPVIHRDVSPASLFVRDRDWAIILFNFNFARKQEGKCTAQIGTTGYASPEQMAGKPDIRSDIYSLGATLHRLLTGRTPGKAFDFKPVSVFNPSVSIYADMAVKKALKVNIKERFNNAGELKEALLEAYDKLGNEEDSWDLPDNEEPFDELSYIDRKSVV